MASENFIEVHNTSTSTVHLLQRLWSISFQSFLPLKVILEIVITPMTVAAPTTSFRAEDPNCSFDRRKVREYVPTTVLCCQRTILYFAFGSGQQPRWRRTWTAWLLVRWPVQRPPRNPISEIFWRWPADTEWNESDWSRQTTPNRIHNSWALLSLRVV